MTFIETTASTVIAEGEFETERLLGIWPEVRHMESRRYQTVMLDDSALPRAVKEMIACVISSTNRCHYCVQHHLASMVEAGVAPALAWQIAQDFENAELDSRTRALLSFAATARPDAVTQTDIDALRAQGLSGRELLEAVIVAGFFHDYNLRVSLFGLELEPWFEVVADPARS